jgi:peroxiredoxin
MKKLLLVLFLFPFLAFAQSNGFVVKGSIVGIADGVGVKLISLQNKEIIASSVIKGGKFSLKGELNEPNLFLLNIGSAISEYLFLENVTIKISGSSKNIKNIKVEGSKAHTDFITFRKTFEPLVNNLSTTAQQINKATSEDNRNELMGKYDSLSKVIATKITEFVAARPSSYVSPFVLLNTVQFNQEITDVEKNYQLLDSTIRFSSLGKALAEYIAYNKVGALGTDAIDFTQNDTAGNPVSLSAFKGKYVLVDFWASWCGPCRKENPNVVNAYEKFKDKNFTVLGVSLDQEKEPWIKAIEKDKLTWTQVSDLQYWSNAAAQLYRVQSIPQNFLIDPTGKIIAKDLRGEALTAKLCELLGCN